MCKTKNRKPQAEMLPKKISKATTRNDRKIPQKTLYFKKNKTTQPDRIHVWYNYFTTSTINLCQMYVNIPFPWIPLGTHPSCWKIDATWPFGPSWLLPWDSLAPKDVPSDGILGDGRRGGSSPGSCPDVWQWKKKIEWNSTWSNHLKSIFHLKKYLQLSSTIF